MSKMQFPVGSMSHFNFGGATNKNGGFQETCLKNLHSVLFFLWLGYFSSSQKQFDKI